MDDWRRQIAIAHLVTKRVEELDVDGVWPHCLPEVAATPEAICNVEKLIGEPLDANYREFLTFANGWRGFYHSVDLFGTGEFNGEVYWKIATELLETLAPIENLCGLPLTDLLPIAVSQDSTDVFVMSRRHTHKPGEVFWFAGQLIDRFSDFDEFFLAMVDYNREDAIALGGQSQ